MVDFEVDCKLNFEYRKCNNSNSFHAVYLQLSGRRTKIKAMGGRKSELGNTHTCKSQDLDSKKKRALHSCLYRTRYIVFWYDLQNKNDDSVFSVHKVSDNILYRVSSKGFCFTFFISFSLLAVPYPRVDGFVCALRCVQKTMR